VKPASELDLRFENYISDAEGWIAMLKADPRFSGVVIAGHSEGSLIGMVAAQHVVPAGYISLNGAGRSAPAILDEQLRKGGLTAEQQTTADRIMSSLIAGKTVPDVSPDFAALFRPSVQPYMISWFKFDPVKEIAKLTCPVLIIGGTHDIQVPVLDARLLASALPATTPMLFPMNHVLKHVDADPTTQGYAITTYIDPSLPLDPGLVDAVEQFVHRVAGH